MSAKKKTGPGFEPGGVVPEPAPFELEPGEQVVRSVSLDGMTAEAVVKLLHEHTGPLVLTATMAEGPLDETVVDGHAYAGVRVGFEWRWTLHALLTACRVAGHKHADVTLLDGGKVQVSLS